jgi:hypothetical protein
VGRGDRQTSRQADFRSLVWQLLYWPHACTTTRSRDEEGAEHLRHRSSAARPLRHCVTAEGERCQAKANAKRLIEESFRFLLEREPNTSILRSFHITDISRYFPNTNVKFGAVWPDEHRLGRRFPA